MESRSSHGSTGGLSGSVGRLGRILAVTVPVLVVLSLQPVTASAHTELVESDPPAQSILGTSPEQMQFWFSEAPARFSVVVVDGTDQRLDRGDAAPRPGAGEVIGVSLPPALPDGIYRARWEAVSPTDGHTTRGQVPFIVGNRGTVPAGVSAGSAASSGGLLGVLVRAVVLTAALVIVGSFAFVPLVLAPGSHVLENLVQPGSDLVMADGGEGVPATEAVPPVAETAVRKLLVIVAFALVFLAAGSVLQMLVDTDVGGWSISQWLIGTRRGTWWLIRCGLIVALAAGVLVQARSLRADALVVLRRRWSWTVLLTLSAGTLVIESLGSHAAGLRTQQILAMAGDFAHLLAAGIWFGGLVQFRLVMLPVLAPLGGPSRTRLLSALVPRFSVLAGTSVAVIAVTGLYQALRFLGGLDALTGRAWGQALLTKSVLFLLVLPAAAFNLVVVGPGLRRLAARLDLAGRQAAARIRTRFRRTLMAEVALVMLILLAVGALTGAAPGAAKSGPAGFVPSGWFRPVILETQAEDIRARLVLSPAVVGLNRYDVTITTTSGQSVPFGTEVRLQFSPLDRKGGNGDEERVGLVGTTRYSTWGRNLTTEGRWEIATVVKRPGMSDVRLPFQVSVTKPATNVAVP